VADQHPPNRESSGTFRNGLDPGAGALTGRKKSPLPVMTAPTTFAAEEWVNEGGSLGPPAGREASARHEGPGASACKEARDTVAGCRDRAAKDRLHAARTDTENGRRAFERSAASWEARAQEIEEAETASEGQRAADRDLWASEERDDPTSPH
jgi:hypothetical protein